MIDEETYSDPLPVAQSRAAWIRGFAAAISEMHRMTRDGNAARLACQLAGVTLATAREARALDIDLDELGKIGIQP